MSMQCLLCLMPENTDYEAILVGGSYPRITTHILTRCFILMCSIFSIPNQTKNHVVKSISPHFSGPTNHQANVHNTHWPLSRYSLTLLFFPCGAGSPSGVFDGGVLRYRLIVERGYGRHGRPCRSANIVCGENNNDCSHGWAGRRLTRCR